MFYIEDKNFISEEQGRHLDDLLKFDLPWYFSPDAYPGDDAQFLYHIVIRRPEARTDKLFNSPTGPFFMKLFNQFTERYDIKYDEIYRCCVNLTFPLSFLPTQHEDHTFPYNHFVIYLNDSDGDTCIFNEKGTEIEKRITPEKHKGVCFEKRLHYAEFPTNGLRFAAVYTFK